MSKLAPIVPERLKARMKFLGYTQANLARSIGIDQTTVSNFVSGKIENSRYLPNIAKLLGCTTDYLTGQTDDPDENAIALPSTIEVQEKFDLVKIVKANDEFGLGETYLDGGGLSEEMLISRSWLRIFTNAAPKDVVIIQGVGNSMEPLISNGDWLICNRAVIAPKRMDDLWVFTHHGMGGVKRIRKDTEGRIELLSDNPSVPNQIATESALHILARVDSIVKRV